MYIAILSKFFEGEKKKTALSQTRVKREINVFFFTIEIVLFFLREINVEKSTAGSREINQLLSVHTALVEDFSLVF